MLRTLKALDPIERVLLLVGFLSVFVAGALVAWTMRTAHAENGGDTLGAVPASYKADRQVAIFRGGTPLTAIDTKTEAGALATTEFVVNLRQNLSVSLRFSNAAATASIRVVRIYKVGATSYVNGISEAVVCTASDWVDTAGRYTAPDVVFDTMGCTHARVIVTTAPSAGNVTIWAGSY